MNRDTLPPARPREHCFQQRLVDFDINVAVMPKGENFTVKFIPRLSLYIIHNINHGTLQRDFTPNSVA